MALAGCSVPVRIVGYDLRDVRRGDVIIREVRTIIETDTGRRALWSGRWGRTGDVFCAINILGAVQP